MIAVVSLPTNIGFMKILNKLLFILLLVFLAGACKYEYIAPPGSENQNDTIPNDTLPDDTTIIDTLSLSQHIEVIFQDASCVDCHNEGMDQNFIPGQAYNSIINYNLVIANDPEASKIYYYPHPVSGEHDFKYDNLEQADLIYEWIDSGAEND